MALNCKDCKGMCCKKQVILTPQEEKESKYKDNKISIKTKSYNLAVLKKNTKGTCIYKDSKDNLCKIYKDRPIDCKTYPLEICFDKRVEFKINNKACQKTDNLSPKQISAMKTIWKEENLPLDWIKAYSKIN